MTKQELIALCMTFPNVYEDYPFDEEWAAMRHIGSNKTFAFVYHRENRVCVNLKCEPMRAEFLRSVMADVLPAYHMNKRHWNTVHADGALTDEEIVDMVKHSYERTK